MEDIQIIDLLFQRVESALERAREKYGRLCGGVARRILPDERDVEECVGDTWLRLWNAIPPDRPNALGAYLARITRNLALDRYTYNHAGKRSTSLTEAFEELEGCLCGGDDAQSYAEAEELKAFMGEFLRAQSAESRKMFVRRYWYGESVKSIAASLGVTEGKVKSSLFRTRSRLHDAMGKEGMAV